MLRFIVSNSSGRYRQLRHGTLHSTNHRQTATNYAVTATTNSAIISITVITQDMQHELS